MRTRPLPATCLATALAAAFALPAQPPERERCHAVIRSRM